ncbi:MAG: hypothetical protein RDU83_03475 [bacterium]|nr:hypothetical protein [bacterium]
MAASIENRGEMERNEVLYTVEGACRRLAARRAWLWSGWVALSWILVVLALVLARAVIPITLPYALLCGLGLAAGVLTFLLLFAFWRVPPLMAAQVLDHRFEGRDRMATAVEVLAGTHPPTALSPAVVADAARWTAVHSPARSIGWLPGRPMWAAVGLAAVTVASGWLLTGFSVPGTPARQVAQTIRQEGRRIERAADAMEDQARLDRARSSRRTAGSLRRLGEDLQRERLDRYEALSRIESLGRQIEASRRQVRARREQSGERPATPDSALPQQLFRQRAALDRTIRQFQEIAERLAQNPSPEERRSLMRQIEALSEGGSEGEVPTRGREQAAAARRQTAAGNTAGARQALRQGAMDMEELRAMLADEEGLTQAQRDLRRSADRIARGGSGAPTQSEQPPEAAVQPGGAAPGRRQLQQGEGPAEQEPPPGPNQGTTAGQGVVQDRLGERTPRLEGERPQTRIRGMQGEGRAATSDLLGPGRPGQVRAVPGRAGGTVRAEADRYMSRMRIPPEYREIVRRYFDALVGSR